MKNMHNCIKILNQCISTIDFSFKILVNCKYSQANENKHFPRPKSFGPQVGSFIRRKLTSTKNQAITTKKFLVFRAQMNKIKTPNLKETCLGKY